MHPGRNGGSLQSGGSPGRPPGPSASTVIRERLNKARANGKTALEAIVDRLSDDAESKDNRAAKLLIEAGWGKTVNISGAEGGPIVVHHVQGFGAQPNEAPDENHNPDNTPAP